FGIAQDVQPGGAGAQYLEDATGADGVADALIDAVAQRNVVVVAHVGEAADFDGVDQKICASQRVQALGGGDDLPGFAALFDEARGNLPGQAQPNGVNVDQGEDTVVQALDMQDVGDKLAREDAAARADEGYFWRCCHR